MIDLGLTPILEVFQLYYDIKKIQYMSDVG
jgi:hypothetical protein